jgi:hypothetical protein
MSVELPENNERLTHSMPTLGFVVTHNQEGEVH